MGSTHFQPRTYKYLKFRVYLAQVYSTQNAIVY